MTWYPFVVIGIYDWCCNSEKNYNAFLRSQFSLTVFGTRNNYFNDTRMVTLLLKSIPSLCSVIGNSFTVQRCLLVSSFQCLTSIQFTPKAFLNKHAAFCLCSSPMIVIWLLKICITRFKNIYIKMTINVYSIHVWIASGEIHAYIIFIRFTPMWQSWNFFLIGWVVIAKEQKAK